MMKILQINKFYYEQGGAEHYFFSLKKLLEEHGHEVIPFAMEHENNLASVYSRYFPSFVDTLKPGLSVPKIKAVGRMFYSFEAKRKLESLIKKKKPQIAHLHNIYHQLSPSIIPVLKKNGIPVVMTVHDYKLVCPNYLLYTKNSPCQKCKKHRYYQVVINHCLKESYLASMLVCLEMYFHKLLKIYEKNIDQFIVPSQFVRNQLMEFGLPGNKIIILPHFISGGEINHSLVKERDYFLFVGRLRKEKGADILIKAATYLPQVEIKLVGVGPDEENLKNLVRKYNLKNITFLGKVSKKDTAIIFQKARAVVVPSRVWETFGLTAAEGMAYGKPVVASRMGALVELVEDGKTGLLFESENPNDLADKLNYLISNPEIAVEMGKKAREKVKKDLNPEKHYQELMKIYDKLLISNS